MLPSPLIFFPVGCGLGKGYNCTTNKCFKCPPGTYNDEATGFHVCKKCGKHQKSVQGGTKCASKLEYLSRDMISNNVAF